MPFCHHYTHFLLCSSEKWYNFTHPDFLIKIKGEEGSCIYTTFEVEGQPNEVRFLRLIARGIAEKNFAKWQEELKDVPVNNERQQMRLDVLKWTAAVDCPSRAQINPELNKWPSLTSMGEELVKSCRVDTAATKRPKSANAKNKDEGEQMRKKFVRSEYWCPVGEKGTYSIAEMNGFVHIVDYKTEEAGADEEEE